VVEQGESIYWIIIESIRVLVYGVLRPNILLSFSTP